MQARAPRPQSPGAPGAERGLVTAATGGSLAAAGLAEAAWALGPPGVACVAAVLGAVVAFGWGRMLDLPSARGTSLVLGTVVLLACTAAVSSHLDDHHFAVSVWWALPVAGGVWASLVHQVWRSDGRPRVVDVVAAEVFAVLVIVSGFLWSWATPGVAVVSGGGLVVTALVDTVLPRRRLVAWLAGALTGVAGALTLGAMPGHGPALVVAMVLSGVAAPTISQATRLVLLRLPAVRSGAAGGVVAGLVSTALAGIVPGLSATLGHALG
ncbi:hypothetical protein [Kytococcus sp. Marseille-QA3725]